METEKFHEKVLKELENTAVVIKEHADKRIDEKVKLVEEKLKKDQQANQQAIDDLLVNAHSKSQYPGKSTKTFGDALAEEIQNKAGEFERLKERTAVVTMQLKTVGVMTTSTHLTGDGMAFQNQRQGLVPNQKINFRDLIPTTPSPSGIYVSYRETGSEGAVDVQTEGETKAKLDFDLTEVKTVSKYIAGMVDFSKQLTHHLSWMQSTLPRLLLREFYKKENAYIYAALVSGATGTTTTVETDNTKALIDVLSARLDADFNNSFIIVKHSEVGKILKSLYTAGYYLGSGSVVGTPDGTVRIMGTPIIGASWATADTATIVDIDFIERVETESLSVTFSYENNLNFEKNLITARVECFEEVNLLRTDAHSHFDLGDDES